MNGITALIAKLTLCACILCTLQGCITFTNYGIPADRVPEFLRAPEKGKRVPLNFALLGQQAQSEHHISAGDIITIYIRGLVPPETDAVLPIVPGQSNFTNVYYPPSGQSLTPSLGVPVEINAAGAIILPQLGPIEIGGLTIDQATAKIAAYLVEKKVAQAGREFVYLSLVRSRVHRVLVIRDESASEIPQFVRKEAPLMTKRGHAQVVDLPNTENDVLHALSISGGLPGFDAYNEVWVLRRSEANPMTHQQLWDATATGQCFPTECMENEAFATAKRIPLWVNPCEPLGFCQEDVILHEGDVVYIRSRDEEYFYTGGLLAGGIVPMPRDHDIDILEAIALANGSIGGAGGASGIAVIPARGPGNIIPPSRATIVRKLPNKQQISIRVDLTKAVRDPKHRVLIQPKDIVSLHYKPAEVTTNAALNIVNLTFIFSPN